LDSEDIDYYYDTDCSSCLSLNAYCYDNGINVTLTGEWIGDLFLIWKCLSLNNSQEEGVSSYFHLAIVILFFDILIGAHQKLTFSPSRNINYSLN